MVTVHSLSGRRGLLHRLSTKGIFLGVWLLRREIWRRMEMPSTRLVAAHGPLHTEKPGAVDCTAGSLSAWAPSVLVPSRQSVKIMYAVAVAFLPGVAFLLSATETRFLVSKACVLFLQLTVFSSAVGAGPLLFRPETPLC